MGNPPRYGGLDAFKVIAALLVVAIHTSPLTTYSPDGDFLLTRSLARVAVPFFFMVTGQFVLGKVLQGRRPFSALWRQVKKILLLYLVAVVLYLPVGLYAGHYQGLSPLSALRLLLFDGTFYHLWYFPACATGLLLVYLLGRVLRGRGLLAVTGLLYLIGLFGDSYYGLTAALPPLAAAYEAGFQVFPTPATACLWPPCFSSWAPGWEAGHPPEGPLSTGWGFCSPWF